MRATTCRNSLLGLAAAAAVLAAAAARADDADDQFAVAANHYDRRQWNFAVEEFHAFLKKHPNDRRVGQSEFFLGEAQLQLGDFDRARQQFQQYAAVAPEGKYIRQAVFRAGEAAYLAGKLDEAKIDLERFRAKYPDDALNAYVLPYLGDIANSNHDPAVASAIFREALKRFPEGQLQDNCRIGLAQALEEQRQTDEAERLYAAVAAKPASPLADAAQFYLGALQYAAGKYDQAIESFSAFQGRLAKSSWRPNAQLGHGWALLKLRRPEQAMKMFDAAAQDPELGVEARYWFGLAQKSQKDWKAAAETLSALATANPSHTLTPAIRFHAGDALLNAGDVPAAIQQFDAVAAMPSGGEWCERAARKKVYARLQAKDHAAVEQAVADFERRFPNSTLRDDVHRLLARSLIERKEFARAAAILEPMIGTPSNAAPSAGQSDYLESHYLLAVAYDGLKRYDDALAMLRPAVESGADALKADALLEKGSLLLATKDYAKARDCLEAFLATKPSGDAAVKGMGELAICCARTDQLEKAKRLFAELDEQYPEHALLLPTIERLSEAAYDANDTRWSTTLADRLTKSAESAEYNHKGRLGIGWSQFKAGNLNEAEATFAEVLKADPPEPIAAEAALVRGQILEQLQQSDAALAMYDVVIDRHPKSKQHGDALLAAARLRDKLKQYESAAACYRRLAEEHPQAPCLDAAIYEWAWVLQGMDKSEEAAAVFQRLHAEFPQSRFWADAVYRLAQRAFSAKDYDRADGLAAEVLAGQGDPRVREFAAYLRGQIAVAKSDWPAARKAFEAFVAEFANSPRCSAATFWIAETYYRQNEFDEAAARFDQLANKAPTNREPWMAMIPLRRAQLMVQKKRWDEAYEIATRIAADFPSFDQQYEVDYLIGRCLANRADFDGARQAYGAVIQSPTGAKTETAAMAQWMIGETFFHQKNYKTALREYLRVEILYAYPTWQAAALLEAGKCQDLLGKPADAAKLYRQILQHYPTTPFAEHARRKLQNSPAKESAKNERITKPKGA